MKYISTCLLGAISLAAFAAPQYQLEVLEIMPTDSYLHKSGSISGSGSIAYSMLSEDYSFKSYTVIDGKKEEIVAPAGYSGVGAYAINANNTVTGAAVTTKMEAAFGLYENGGWFLPDTTLTDGTGRAINKHGDVVGQSREGAFTYINGELVVYPEIYALNGINADQVAVGENGEDDGRLPVIVKNGEVEVIRPFDTHEATGEAINNKNHIVGAYFPNDSYYERAYVYKNGESIDLGIDGGHSAAYDINNKGKIVGYAELEGTACEWAGVGECATLWERDADGDYKLHDLNDLVVLNAEQSGYILANAWSINGDNEIFVQGTDENETPFVGVLRVKK